jgi:phosphoribosyl 1,2-cyclic phosphate phosphodiesterase
VKVTILGCGPSSGVPIIGDVWGDCDPKEPRNRRRRASILIETDDVSVLVDTSPDCREQLLDAGVTRLDAVLFTHAHADHSHGIDELRWINVAMNAPLPTFGDAHTLEILHDRFGYVFTPLESFRGRPLHYYKPVLVPHEIIGPFDVGAMHVVPFEQEHGFRSKTQGFRIGSFAYSTDVSMLDEAAFAVLDGIDTWIVDAFRRKEHSTHAHLDLALQWIERIRPRRAVLTHMGGDMDYRTLCEELPPGVEPGYDGMVLTVD